MIWNPAGVTVKRAVDGLGRAVLAVADGDLSGVFWARAVELDHRGQQPEQNEPANRLTLHR